MFWILYEPWFYFFAILLPITFFNLFLYRDAEKDLRKTRQFRINRLYEEYEKQQEPNNGEREDEYLNFRRYAMFLKSQSLAMKPMRKKSRHSSGAYTLLGKAMLHPALKNPSAPTDAN